MCSEEFKKQFFLYLLPLLNENGDDDHDGKSSGIDTIMMKIRASSRDCSSVGVTVVVAAEILTVAEVEVATSVQAAATP